MAMRAESSQAIRSVSAAKHASDSGSIRSNLESDGVVILVSILRSRRTVELTRRRESKHPSPCQVSYETRSRRSRPTICSVAPGHQTKCSNNRVDSQQKPNETDRNRNQN